MRYFISFLYLFFFVFFTQGQSLHAGFDSDEFMELLRIQARFSQKSKDALEIEQPLSSTLVYKSPDMGLANSWQLWIKDEHTAVIAIRGTVQEKVSWLANLYAAQIPASGRIEVDSNFIFDYKLANNERASVHVGYVLGAAFLSQDILPKIDSLYQVGVKDFLIAGHSQGGGLSYILTSYLMHLQQAEQLPADLRFKMYASASPKPGNLYYAYDFEHLMGTDWAFNVVNMEDWVPQTPFSVQTLGDLPKLSPLQILEQSLKKQSFFKRLFFKSIYKKLTRPSEKAVKAYQKYLGTFAAKQIRGAYPSFVEPAYAESNYYERAGTQIILYPDSNYYEKYPFAQGSWDFMHHHWLRPYLFLMEKYKQSL